MDAPENQRNKRAMIRKIYYRNVNILLTPTIFYKIHNGEQNFVYNVQRIRKNKSR